MPDNPSYKLITSEVSLIKSGGRHIIMQKNNGTLWGFKNVPFSVAGTSYLPLRFVSEALGANVEWLQKDEKITITLP